MEQLPVIKLILSAYDLVLWWLIVVWFYG